MSRLPTGTVTFLFTDIEGSTALLQQLPDAYGTAMMECRRLVRAAVQERGGHEVGTQGDAVFAAFPSAREALLAAIAAQRAVLRHSWPDGATVKVRMGLHTGEARVEEGDYVGLDVHRAARICAAGHGGQVLISQAVAVLAASDLPASVHLRDLGRHRLRDLKEPEHLYQVVHPDLPADFPPLRSLSARPNNNLPIQLTSFIGRAREMAEVKRLLGTARLVTLTGSGGAGKTRLALQVASDVLDGYLDGVWLAEFASLADPALVPKTVASAMNVSEQPGRDITETLVDALRPKASLLVLDNCEHLLAACGDLAVAVLRACPQMRLLATSREGLGIPGETLWRVPSLTLPDARRLPPDDLVLYDAVRLFVDRAIATATGFAVTSENARAVAQICQRLDGIPLAIELAAARVRVLSVERIAARLDDQFRLLTGGSRTVLPRQQTLRGTMDWSFDLMSERERTLFRRLSVFAGSWSLEAAEAVCSGNDVEPSDMLDVLTQLVDKSLVTVDTDTDRGGTRYRLLATVRQYGMEKLLQSAEVADTRQNHLDWYLWVAERGEAELKGPQQPIWLAVLETECDNLRLALDWATGKPGNAIAALRLAGALSLFWFYTGRFREGSDWLENALSRSHGKPASARAKALLGAAWLAVIQPNYQRSDQLSEESLILYCQLNDKSGVGNSLRILAVAAQSRGDYERANALLRESLGLFREAGDLHGIAGVLNGLGEVARCQGEYETARGYYEENLALRREAGHRAGTAVAITNLAHVALYQGDYRQAAKRYAEAMGLARPMYKRTIASCLAGLSKVAAAEQEPERAARLSGAAENLLDMLGVRLEPPDQVEYDRWITATRAELGQTRFIAGQAEGRAMTLEQAIEYALAGEAN